MTKADLVAQIVKDIEVTRKEADVIVTTFLEGIVEAVRSGEKVEIRGFGSFRTRSRNSRVGRNPKTGEQVVVPASTIPFFKASKQLREAVNDGTPTD